MRLSHSRKNNKKPTNRQPPSKVKMKENLISNEIKPPLMILQRQVGNRAVQKRLAGSGIPALPDVRHFPSSDAQPGVVQRTPKESGESAPSEAASKQVGGVKDAWDAIVQARLEGFLNKFQNIPVRVAWEENGEKKETTVYVQPPYFINTERYKKSKQRKEAAERHRKEATGSEKKAPVEASWYALHGKSTPEEIQSILERALAAGKIPTPEGKKHPGANDLRSWLRKFGIGVDCSGFVSQALMQVMTEARTQAGVQGPVEKIKKGSGGLKGGSKGFSKVGSPVDIRPGDTMHTRGHIRIVMAVERSEGGVVFTTAESSSSPDDIGPHRAVWRYLDTSKFEGLQHEKGKSWREYKKTVTFGHYERLEAFTSEHIPREYLKDERKPEEPLETEEKSLLEKIEEGAKALITTSLRAITAVAEGTKELLKRAAQRLREIKVAPATGAESKKWEIIRSMEPSTAMLKIAVYLGERNEIKLTDLVFHTRHPERGEKPIGKDEKELAKEWIKIRNELVQPMLKQER